MGERQTGGRVKKARTSRSTPAFPFITRPQLALAFGKDARTIAKWLEEGLPVARRGKGGRPSLYHVRDCVTWVLARELHARAPQQVGDATGLQPQLEHALLERRKREEIELKLQVRRGELVEIAAVRAEYADIATTVKARLRAIPTAVADQMIAAAAVGPVAVRQLLAARIDQALRELARTVDLTPPDAGSDAPVPSLEEASA